jgi:hypothetical protein
MDRLLVMMAPDLNRTRLLIVREGRDLINAILPPVTMAHPTAATRLLEALALWYQQRLCVALCVDEQRHCCETVALYDALANGVSQLYFDVAVVAHEHRRDSDFSARGDFSDLRALRLECKP